MLALLHTEFVVANLITSLNGRFLRPVTSIQRLLPIRYMAIDTIRVSDLVFHESSCSAGRQRHNSLFKQHVNLGVSKIFSNLRQ